MEKTMEKVFYLETGTGYTQIFLNDDKREFFIAKETNDFMIFDDLDERFNFIALMIQNSDFPKLRIEYKESFYRASLSYYQYDNKDDLRATLTFYANGANLQEALDNVLKNKEEILDKISK